MIREKVRVSKPEEVFSKIEEKVPELEKTPKKEIVETKGPK